MPGLALSGPLLLDDLTQKIDSLAFVQSPLTQRRSLSRTLLPGFAFPKAVDQLLQQS